MTGDTWKVRDLLLRVAKSTAVAVNVGAVWRISCWIEEPSLDAKYLSSVRNTRPEFTVRTPFTWRVAS